MKRFNFDVVSEGLNVNVTDGAKRDTTVGFKPVNETLTLDLCVELLFNGDKRLGVNSIKLIIAPVVNQILKNCLLISWSINCVAKQDSFCWQWLVGTGADFR